jgi:hypothetical protein
LIGSRLIIFATIFLSRLAILPGPSGLPPGSETKGILLSVLNCWDSTWYRTIAQEGYATLSLPWRHGIPLAPSFFPFYPLLIKAVGFVARDYWIAAVLVSNICFLVAAVLFDVLMRLDYPEEKIRGRAAAFLMFSPVSFFFSTGYSESTFLMLAIGAFLAARKQQWLVASLLGMCCTATRAPGFLLAIPLLVEYVEHWRGSQPTLKTFLRPSLFSFGLIPLGLVGYMVYCYFRLGDPFVWMHAHHIGWTQRLSFPWVALFFRLNEFEPFYRWLYVGVTVVAILIFAAGIWLRVRTSYLVWTGVILLFNLSWGRMEAAPRYLIIVFPLFIILGLFTTRFPKTYELLFAGSTALLILCTVVIANGYLMT